MNVSYRKAGKKWYIRFRESGKKEITKKYPGTIHESTIADKVTWFREEIALDRFDPWSEQKQQERDQKLGMPLGMAIDKYIKDGVHSGRWKTDHRGKSRTARTNRQRLEYLMKFTGDIATGELTGQQVNEYIQQAPVSAYSKRSYLSAINTFLRWLYDKGHKEHLEQGSLPYATKQQAKQVERTPRGVTFFELKRLCVGVRRYHRKVQADPYAKNYSDIRWGINALSLVFAMMLRKDEVNKIYPCDLSYDMSEVTIGNKKQSFRPAFIPKGGIATIPTTSLMRKILTAMNVTGMDPRKPIIKRSPDRTYKILVKAREHVDPTIRLHDLRHGGVMYYRSQGWPESLVSELARHESSETTARMYGGTDTSELKRTLTRYDK